MGVTKIEWTSTTLPDGTVQPGFSFNPWHGCVKVSQGCKFCYADAQDKRFGESHWGPSAPRKLMSEAYWRQPLRWNRDAAEAGVRARVFCASMADVFERLPADHESAGAVEDARARLWQRIDVTTSLDWLLLTKRPENIAEMVPSRWLHQGFPENVWIGTSVEDQAAADTRIPHLLKVPARVRFLSCEPLLGPVDLPLFRCPGCHDWRSGETTNNGKDIGCVVCGHYLQASYQRDGGIHWVICGGESGPHARPMHPDWARGLRDQCQAAGVPFFFKQWGAWLPSDQLRADGTNAQLHQAALEAFGAKANIRHEWPDEERFRSHNVGKKDAGRLLDGQTWDEFPPVQEATR